MNPRIPQCDPAANYRRHAAAIDAAIRRVLDSGRYLLGQETEAFEAEFANFLGMEHAVATSSGTDALVLALKACGIGTGDEVITVAHTAVATVAAICLCGATPVFVDIDPETLLLDSGLLPKVVTPRTRAIIPVHLYGYAAAMLPIMEFARSRGLKVIEDCAQAPGAMLNGSSVGSFGDAAAFSFYPTKNLSALGDAGLVATNDPAIAERLRLLRQYGWRERYVSEIAGQNARMDELQAAVLRVKLPFLHGQNARRVQLAAIYRQALSAASVQLPPEQDGAVNHQFVIRSSHRDALAKRLATEGIETLVHYPVPIHQQPAYRQNVSLPHTEAAARTVLSLPMFPELSLSEAGRVAEQIRISALKEHAPRG